ncbi:MAG: hypothetical protein N2053_02010, partial [Chitinispirillaceae bacterium]|nr:hypothetical protein [Chitinispirillaceae bacterium]
GIGAHILGEKEYVDLSKMTSLSLRAKGKGVIRVYFESKYISDKYDWGHIGYIIELTSSWKTYDIKIKDLQPAPWSDPEKDGVTWDDCKKEINTFMIEASAPADGGDKEDAEFYIDDIIFKGMKYSDIITPASVRSTAPTQIRKSSFRVKNRNITYTISKSEPVFFSLFDLKGCEIAKISGKSEAGTHTLTIAPKISQGKYLIRMNNSDLRSFTIIK